MAPLPATALGGVAAPGPRALRIVAVTDPDDDVALARAARTGDRGAFGRLCDRHQRFVRGILLARVPRRDVDDLAQEVFLRALRRVDALRDVDAFGPWIAAIARNLATDRLRRAPALEVLPDELPGGHSAESSAPTILAAIRGLPDTYRETLILRLVQGMTGPEIAERTGMTPGSVRVHLHRGMKLLREALTERGAHVG
jgi:RNA polymerase sigma-70 factor (ECF subfamily)